MRGDRVSEEKSEFDRIVEAVVSLADQAKSVGTAAYAVQYAEAAHHLADAAAALRSQGL